MKQIFQDMSDGKTKIITAPAPTTRNGFLLCDSTVSLISAGTERMLVDFGKASLLDKALKQPDRVKQIIQKASTDGFLTTYDAVRSKLGEPIPMGYCNVGVVSAVGDSVSGYQVGNRIVSNGPHADIVNVPNNLTAKIPNGVSDEAAAFTVVASIALQGIRLSAPNLGDSYAVIGVGLIGLLAIQLLRANGCRVIAIDFDPKKLKLANEFGAETCNPANGEDPVTNALKFSDGRGVDGVIITASTKSSDPVCQAAQMCRKRAKIVLVGVTGLTLNRADFYEKELTFQVSCSYGPGRYDSTYEEEGHDYPIGFVRWTEQRNFQAILELLADGSLNVEPLVTHRFKFEDAENAYQTLSEDSGALGLVLEYRSEMTSRHQHLLHLSSPTKFVPTIPTLGFIGAGNYASRVLIPAFKFAGAQLHTIATSGGTSSAIQGAKAGFAVATTDVDAMLRNSNINTVAIATRHNSHTHFVLKSLKASKHVFVEKPLAITKIELAEVQAEYLASRDNAVAPHLMVGFNRRFSPHAIKMRTLIEPVSEPLAIIITVNAGAIPASHWTQELAVGGGRIIGEACHFIDLMRFLAKSEITSVQAKRMGDRPNISITEDKASITLGFANGSFGTIHYFGNGSTVFPKERIEVFTAGRVLQLDNFRKLTGYGWPGFRRMNLWRQDKGQKACAIAFLKAIEKGGEPPISAAELFEVARVTIEAAELLRQQ